MVYDYGIVGLGAAGLAALSYLSSKGHSCVGFEQHQIGHDLGSTHGETRAIRQAYFEHSSYVPLLLDAYKEWKFLEDEFQIKLLVESGCLIMGPKTSSVIQGCKVSAENFSLDYELLSASQIKEKYNFNLNKNEVGFYEPHGGYLLLDPAMKVFESKAKKHGAKIIENSKVVGVEKQKSTTIISTLSKSISVKKFIYCLGPWVKKENISKDVLIKRVILSWFEAKNQSLSSPVFFRDGVEKPWVYGFPAIDGKIKASYHNYYSDCDPDQIERSISFKEIEYLKELTADFNPCLGDAISSKTCMYTMTKDEHFLIDKLDDNIMVLGGLSGHGFKFSSVFGKIVEQVFDEKNHGFDLSLFRVR